MATYKVLQDIEAEDHILGPLSLRQFIYALIATFFLYICFICITKHLPFLLIVFLPPAIFTGFFAFPFRQDQPTEVWALAKIRFLFKPRQRIWDQSGVKELVTITVPKKIEHAYSNGLSQVEVKSRLRALADTIDTRGWAIKNVNVNLYSQPSLLGNDEDSERLIDIATMPQAVPDYDVLATDDILDEQSSPVAQQMEQMISASTVAHRQQAIDQMNQAGAQAGTTQTPAGNPPADYWFLQPAATAPTASGQTTFPQAQIVSPGADSQTTTPQPVTGDDIALLEHLKAENTSQHVPYTHLRTIQPLDGTNPVASLAPITALPLPPAPAAPSAPVTATPDPAILSLANNNDLNVATIAREAHKTSNPDEPLNEVVISLR
jgi:hypothetical protein